jgi:excisionase family DNA binding protein
MSEETQFLTPKEVAGILGVHQKTIHLWLRTGKLEGTKISYRTWRIPRTSFEAFLKDKSNNSPKNTTSIKKENDLQSTLPAQNITTDIPPQSKMKSYIRDIMGEETQEKIGRS